MRKAFIKALCEAAKVDKKIMLLTGDLGFNVLEPFKEAFPDRFMNVGVAEANLATVAAGLASVGFKPFIYSIATFVSMRPFEQIRNDIALHKMNVKIVGVGGGLAYTKAGPTHHSMEDIALMRTLPDMTIISPSNPMDAYLATKALLHSSSPAYLRIERTAEIDIPYEVKSFAIGKAQLVLQGTDIVIVTTGSKLATGYTVSKQLHKKGISAGLYQFSTVCPLDASLLRKLAKQFPLIVTIEEHRIDGGFGSAVGEELLKISDRKAQLLKYGLRNTFTPFSSDYTSLLRFHSLLPEQITKMILKETRSHRSGKTYRK